jgi:methyl-accepting chemotaxis protein
LCSAGKRLKSAAKVKLKMPEPRRTSDFLNRPVRRTDRVSFRLLALFFLVFVMSAAFNAVIVWFALDSLNKVRDEYRRTEEQATQTTLELNQAAEKIVRNEVKRLLELYAKQASFHFHVKDAPLPPPGTARAQADQAAREAADAELGDLFRTATLGPESNVLVFDPDAQTVLIHKVLEPGTRIEHVSKELVQLLETGSFMRQIREQRNSGTPGLANRTLTDSEVFREERSDGTRKLTVGRLWVITSIPGTSYAIAGSTTLESATRDLMATAAPVLEKIRTDFARTERQSEQITKTIVTVLVVLGALSLIIFLTLYSLVDRQIISPIQTLTATAERIRRGNYEVRAPLTGAGEFRDLAFSINNMLDRIVGLIESEEDKKHLHASIERLTELVSLAARGDLTPRGEPEAGQLATVTDAINIMLESIGRLVVEVRAAGGKVTRSAGHLRGAVFRLNEGAAMQSAKINSSVKEVESVAVWIRQATEQAGQAQTLSEQTASNANIGARSVRDSLRGMHRIRMNVQAASKKIKSLGDKSLEINAIVELINDIAVQTNGLALNASIEASRAGEAGRGFAVVAEEVRKLAERVSLATRDISAFIQGIQDDTGQSVQAMDEVTGEVEEGVKLAEKAGSALNEIADVADATQQQVRAIFQSASEQSEAIELLVALQSDILQITKGTEHAAHDMQATVDELVSLSQNLAEAIRRFKVQEAPVPQPLDDIEARKKELLASLSYFSELSERASDRAVDLKADLDFAMGQLAGVAERARTRLEELRSGDEDTGAALSVQYGPGSTSPGFLPIGPQTSPGGLVDDFVPTNATREESTTNPALSTGTFSGNLKA